MFCRLLFFSAFLVLIYVVDDIKRSSLRAKSSMDNFQCAMTAFITPRELYRNRVALGLLVTPQSNKVSFESMGKLVDADLTRGIFVAGCKNQLVWSRTLDMVYTDALIVYATVCEMEDLFNEINMHFFTQLSPCVKPSSYNCLRLLNSSFVCVEGPL